MGTLLKELTDAINDVDRAGAPPGTRRQRADGRTYVKQPDGSWTPEPGQEGKPEERQPKPGGKISSTDPATLTPARFNRELDQLEKLDSQNNQALIDAGYGSLKPTEIRALDDPLGARYGEIQDRKHDMAQEMRNRMGPGTYARLPSGARRRKEKADIRKVLPSPSGGEDQDKFISRCMSWMDDNEGDRPQDQQLAMCFDKFREGKEQGGQTVTRAELFAEVQQNAGYLVKIATRIQARKQNQDDAEERKEDGARTRMEGPLENLTSETIQK